MRRVFQYSKRKVEQSNMKKEIQVCDFCGREDKLAMSLQKKYITSPIIYMGSKKRLIKRGLIDLFPESINILYEMFCGSAVVSANTTANEYFINDNCLEVVELIKLFKDEAPNVIIDKLETLVTHYSLPTFSTDNRIYHGNRDIFKQRYNKLRDDYNKTRNIYLLYLLHIYSNSHMIRFNSSGDFNMPFGNGYLTRETKEAIQNNTYKKIQHIDSFDFRTYVNKVAPSSSDFIYFDPPYFGTTATYNENDRWTKKEEIDLHKICDEYTQKGIRWGMSNVFENKGVVNDDLKTWQEKNGYKVHFFNDFTYSGYRKGNSNAVEVYIYNY